MAETVRNLNVGCQENRINYKYFEIYTQFSLTVQFMIHFVRRSALEILQYPRP